MSLNTNHKKYYYLVILLGVVIHTSLMFFTYDDTYDIFVHIFFADHYEKSWFDTWDYRWYTGFTVTSYPPLVHHCVALISKIVGLELGIILWSCLVVFLIIRGVYHFSLIWVGQKAALMAALMAVFSTSIAEALHIFGQMPSLTGSALLLNACPEIYRWLRNDSRSRLVLSLLFFAVISTAHHVTTIFGMVFFVMPVLGVAVFDRVQEKLGDEEVTFRYFFQEAWRLIPRLMAFGMTVIAITITVIFPYWYWSKSDPITQVPIPHGSRDSFIDVTSSGLVFFLIPWGMMLLFLPFLFTRLFRKRYIFLFLSVSLLFVLGTGGTTPIPRMMLGDTAFEILTLDRFTYWGTLIGLPFWGLFIIELFQGRFKELLTTRAGSWTYRAFRFLILGGIVVSFVLVVNISFFRTLQPERIDIEPITKFLEKDYHDRWRYLTLGFGDQMAWLAANTDALSVDGNYHSVRRLPEMTSRAVERLENAKYRGEDGISALRQFLTVPERYNLKFIFSNDQFYDPLLHYSGWRKLQSLENDIVVWEKPDVPPLPAILPKKEIPKTQRLMWGILPISFFLLLISYLIWLKAFKTNQENLAIDIPVKHLKGVHSILWPIQATWILGLIVFIIGINIYQTIETSDYHNPDNLLQAFYHEIDFKNFNKAYEYLDPDTRPSLEQFLLQQSIKGGMLSSYAKLDSLSLEERPIGNDSVLVSATANWITSLEEYKTIENYTVLKKDNRWYIQPSSNDPTEPADVLVNQTSIDFYSQGRRKALVNYTLQRDIVDRPEVCVIQSQMIQRDSQYFVIGELINVDNDPAHVTVSAVIYDQFQEELLSFNARDYINCRLMPKESTSFLINLQEERTSSLNTNDFEERIPSSFVLFIRSVVTDENIYQNTALEFSNVTNSDQVIVNLFNHGTEEVVIPKVMTSQYEGDTLKWIDINYLPFGVKPQRKLSWKLSLSDIDDVSIIDIAEEGDIIVNGLTNRITPGINSLIQLATPKFKISVDGLNYSVRFNVESFTSIAYED
ncbi:MAG: hypothetical protein HKN68_18880 [Saprospiraceae bacterium]|nr:hypothetical protein [Saprospiraceae bacterium]